MRYLTADEDFLKTYTIELVAGRWFSREFPSDREQAFLLNESGVKHLGFNSPEDAIGKKVAWQNRKGEIIGVVKGFHFMSLNTEIYPFIIPYNRTNPGYLSVKMNEANLSKIMDQVKNKFNEVMPGGIFEYFFLDDDFDKQYKADEKFMVLFTLFSGIAIVIACLGLYGLSAFTTEARTKEIGIRKALGATVTQIFTLLTGKFSKLVMISFIVALPAAAWVMNKWLENYPYKTQLNLWIFVLASIGLLLIAVLTVGFHSLKAARINPANTFREE